MGADPRGGGRLARISRQRSRGRDPIRLFDIILTFERISVDDIIENKTRGDLLTRDRPAALRTRAPTPAALARPGLVFVFLYFASFAIGATRYGPFRHRDHIVQIVSKPDVHASCETDRRIIVPVCFGRRVRVGPVKRRFSRRPIIPTVSPSKSIIP